MNGAVNPFPAKDKYICSWQKLHFLWENLAKMHFFYGKSCRNVCGKSCGKIAYVGDFLPFLGPLEALKLYKNIFIL